MIEVSVEGRIREVEKKRAEEARIRTEIEYNVKGANSALVRALLLQSKKEVVFTSIRYNL